MKLFGFLLLFFLLFLISNTQNPLSNRKLQSVTPSSGFWTGLSSSVVSFRNSAFGVEIYNPDDGDYQNRIIKIILVGVIPAIIFFLISISYTIFRCFYGSSATKQIKEEGEIRTKKKKLILKSLLLVGSIFFLIFLILICVMESETVSDLNETTDDVINNIKGITEERLKFSRLYYSFSPEPDLEFEERTISKKEKSDKNMDDLQDNFALRYIFLIIILIYSFIIEIFVILQLFFPGKCGTFTVTSVLILSSVFLCMYGINLAFSAGVNDVCEGLKKNEKQNFDYFLSSFTNTSLSAGNNNINNEIFYDFYNLTLITKPDVYTKENYTECRANISKYCGDDIECKEKIETLLDDITTCYDILDQIEYYVEHKDLENMIPEDKICKYILPEFNFLSAGYLALAILYIIIVFIILYYFKIVRPNYDPFSRKKSQIGMKNKKNNLNESQSETELNLVNDGKELDGSLDDELEISNSGKELNDLSH
ncbi:transmembrane protein [Anaeramoeba flamelloides]|uniref:Transmembrane protein n=1 Tax=Anaeramoeba flamelloides TaxID=1746091 RepID=A0AAV7ZCF0_9EUKA|nr:transmembrane protein [Anaeramoeba flamelloides]